jgi:hypothetical protein
MQISPHAFFVGETLYTVCKTSIFMVLLSNHIRVRWSNHTIYAKIQQV